MEEVRILLADMERTVLAQIMEKIAAYRPNMEVVGRCVNRSTLSDDARNANANVIVLGLAESELPEICTSLLDTMPDVVVVGVAADGRCVLIQAENLGTNELMATIRAACGVSHSQMEPGSDVRH